ncbi:MAG TPA: hypothetical protein VKE26_01250 [Xanthobacteraceae bacterium]|nr:hypothetical protein [Xanthobacteraceae bacterium]
MSMRHAAGGFPRPGRLGSLTKYSGRRSIAAPEPVGFASRFLGYSNKSANDCQTTLVQHEAASVRVMHADEVDRGFLVVDAVGARIHHGIEQDVGVAGGGKVADLAGARPD